MTLLGFTEKLERLLGRLPEPLRKPLLREISPVKDIFLRQRPPRILVLGSPKVPETDLVNTFFGSEVAHGEPEWEGGGFWQRYSRAKQGTLNLLDARNLGNLNRIQSELAAECPDLVLVLQWSGEPIAAEQAQHAERLLGFIDQRTETQIPLIGVAVIGGDEAAEREAVQKFKAELRAFPSLNRRLAEALPLAMEVRPPEGESTAHRLCEAIAMALPNEAKLEMARLSGARTVQVHIAQILVRSMAAISGAIGAQPIPLADFPILTSLQALMVASIMAVSGRELSMKLAAEFIAALGANIGVGLFFREGARAMLRLLPGFGNAISGAVASAGTYAIGRSATAYFIEGASISDARRLFRRAKKPALL
jgi:uncharacterized protein (DUF697 family)